MLQFTHSWNGAYSSRRKKTTLLHVCRRQHQNFHQIVPATSAAFSCRVCRVSSCCRNGLPFFDIFVEPNGGVVHLFAGRTLPTSSPSPLTPMLMCGMSRRFLKRRNAIAPSVPHRRMCLMSDTVCSHWPVGFPQKCLPNEDITDCSHWPIMFRS